MLVERMGITEEDFMKKKCAGIYKRVFHMVGASAINRRIDHARTVNGLKKMHHLIDVGHPGWLQTRQASCTCKNCTTGSRVDIDWSKCERKGITGGAEDTEVKTKAPGLIRITRNWLKEEGVRLSATCVQGDIIAVEMDGEVAELTGERFMLGEVDSHGVYTVERGYTAGDQLLDVIKYCVECLEKGIVANLLFCL